MDVYGRLKEALQKEVERNDLSGQNISVRCKALSSEEAIGTPEHDDYPLVKGREVMVEAVFNGARGQAFADEFENRDYSVDELLSMSLDSNKARASFVSGLNAVCRHLELCDKTVHCRNEEPKRCAEQLPDFIGPRDRILVVGYQPRFVEYLSKGHEIRVLDLDHDNIGSNRFGVEIEPPEAAPEAMDWCRMIFATGSTVVNGTIEDVLTQGKPVLFYGVTISGPARILNLDTYCQCGH